MAYLRLFNTGLPISFGQCIVSVERAGPRFSRTAGRKAKGVNCATAAACPSIPRNFLRFKRVRPGKSNLSVVLASKTRKGPPCAPLFPLNAAYKHLKKLFGIHLGADFRVGFHFVDAFDDVAVAIREMM